MYFPDAQWQNFSKAWNDLNFPLLFRNTLIIAIFGTFGAVASSVFVAYGFARFDFKGKNVAVHDPDRHHRVADPGHVGADVYHLLPASGGPTPSCL